VGLDPQSLQWFRFLSPERLAIDIENRKNQENLAKKKLNKAKAPLSAANSATDTSKIKVEGLRRKKRRMKLKRKMKLKHEADADTEMLMLRRR